MKILVRNSEMQALGQKIEDNISGLQYAKDKAEKNSTDYLLLENLLSHLYSASNMLDIIVQKNEYKSNK